MMMEVGVIVVVAKEGGVVAGTGVVLVEVGLEEGVFLGEQV